MSKKVIILGSDLDNTEALKEINIRKFDEKDKIINIELELLQKRLELEEEIKSQMESQIYNFENISKAHNHSLDYPNRSKKRKRGRIR